MRTEAADAGRYTSKLWHDKDYPRIQILTIEGLLDGTERIETPPQLNPFAMAARKPHGKDRRRCCRAMSRNSKDHPVWDVYDELRTARLNIKCLTCEIARLRRCSTTIEVVLALSGATSIGDVAWLQNPLGKTIWGGIGFISMMLIALKPVFPFAEQRTKKERLLISYRILEHDLDCVRIGIRERGEYDDQAKREFRSALVRKAELVLHGEGSCAKKIRQKCQTEVLNELPDSDFYIPG